MSFPWYLKPEILLHRDLVEGQMDLEIQANRKDRRDQDQDRQLADLQKRVRELEQQLLALETVLDRQGLIPPQPEPEQPAQTDDTPAVFPARTSDPVTCPRCGKQQRGDRNLCFFCSLKFQYET